MTAHTVVGRGRGKGLNNVVYVHRQNRKYDTQPKLTKGHDSSSSRRKRKRHSRVGDKTEQDEATSAAAAAAVELAALVCSSIRTSAK